MLINFSDLLRGLPSFFFMNKEDAVTLLRTGDSCFIACQDGLYIKRRFTHRYVNETRTRQGGMIVSEFMGKIISNLIESRREYETLRIQKEIHSPYEYRTIDEALITVREKAKLLFLESSQAGHLGLEVAEGPTMPNIEADRLTISSEDSVWNHFKMCATIAASGDTPIVNMITTETSVEIHATNDHEEYVATVPIIGGEPVTRQAIGIPVALINEVSYWMETGLHTESHLDIWFDENHVKFGTRANQVLAQIEEYQPQKFDWQLTSQIQFKEMDKLERQSLQLLLDDSTNEQLKTETPQYYDPLIEFYLNAENLFLQMNSYQRNLNCVNLGITELRDFVEHLDITQSDLNLKIQVNPQENYVIFCGELLNQEPSKKVKCSYLILGVVPDTRSRNEIFSDISVEEKNQSCSPKEVKSWVDWTGKNSLCIDGIKFIERFPLDFREDSTDQKQSKQLQSLAKHEPPFNNLIKLIQNLVDEINEVLESYANSVFELITEKMNGLEKLKLEPSDILAIFKSNYSSDYENYALLTQTLIDLNTIINQKQPEMFEPEASRAFIQTLEQAYQDAKWVYFTFLNTYYWGNENPRLWQQTFNP